MDFIITWVDGNDPDWQLEYYKHKNIEDESTNFARFRDWQNLHYWFRGVEKYAPWVDKIHFVTWGHLPTWLKIDHPKLNIVTHKDFIPTEYLPTFNASAIEINFHRIKELAEEYVYFNDDTFLINNMHEKQFFKNGKICDEGKLSILKGYPIDSMKLQDIAIINRHFNKFDTLKRKPANWLNLKYGLKNSLNNLLLFLGQRNNFSGFSTTHLPQAHKKRTLQLLWEKEFYAMNKSSISKFRNYNAVNQYLQRYWELASNNFNPTEISKLGKYFPLNNVKLTDVTSYIKTQKAPMICVNDHSNMERFQDMPFEKIKDNINQAFEKILPEKSTFER